jgi:hypothetical protein
MQQRVANTGCGKRLRVLLAYQSMHLHMWRVYACVWVCCWDMCGIHRPAQSGPVSLRELRPWNFSHEVLQAAVRPLVVLYAILGIVIFSS